MAVQSTVKRAVRLRVALAAGAVAAMLFGLACADEQPADDDAPSVVPTSTVASIASPTAGAPPAPGSGRTVVDTPASWGHFLVVPVVAGVPVADPEPALPEFSASALSGSFEGESAPAQAAEAGLRLVEIPEAYRHGAVARGAEARQEPDGSAFVSSVFYATPDERISIRVSAYTPTASVAVLAYPDVGVYRMELNNDVNGEPTIVMMPHPATSDPSGERHVMWSQGEAVYFVTTTGAFTDEEVIDMARHVSEAEADR